MAENGEALKYIELVLRKLQRASRDHRQLMKQRHADFQYEIRNRSMSRTSLETINEQRRSDFRNVVTIPCTSRVLYEGSNDRVWHHRGSRQDDLIDVPRTWSRSSSNHPWELDLTFKRTQLSEYSRPDVTTRLLTKRRNYGGIAQSTAAPRRIHDKIPAVPYQELRYVSACKNGGDCENTRETFVALNLPERSSYGDAGTSSIV